MLREWPYYREITISNSSGEDLRDYQIKLILNTSIVTGCNSNLSDIRFTFLSEQLPYWIRNDGGGPPTPIATNQYEVWVKVPLIPITGTIIRMYYGNANASNISNGDATFELFDHFDGPTLNTNKWQAESVGLGGSFSNSSIAITPTTNDDNKYGFTSKIEYSANYGIVGRLYTTATTSVGVNAGLFGLIHGLGGFALYYGFGNYFYVGRTYYGEYASLDISITPNSYKLLEFNRLYNKSDYLIDNTLIYSSTTSIYNNPYKIGCGVGRTTAAAYYEYIDYIYIRKLVAVVPMVSIDPRTRSNESYLINPNRSFRQERGDIVL